MTESSGESVSGFRFEHARRRPRTVPIEASPHRRDAEQGPGLAERRRAERPTT